MGIIYLLVKMEVIYLHGSDVGRLDADDKVEGWYKRWDYHWFDIR